MKYNHPKNVDEVRNIALGIIYEVLEKGAYANLQLEKDLRNTKVPVNDRRLITELVNGTVRMSKHLDWVLNLFLKKPLNGQNPWIRNILRMALYQILFMDRIPQYASVNTAVDLTTARVGSGLTGMVNGVLRNIIRNPEKITYPSSDNDLVAYLAVYYSHPEWLIKQWLEDFGYEQTVAILVHNNLPAGVTVRCNQLKGSRDELITRLADEGVLATVCENTPWGLKVYRIDKAITDIMAFKEGWFYVQDSASLLAAPILRPQPGQMVYDLCCGVGGKTTHIAEYMQNQGRIVAIDLHKHKIDLLGYNSRRLGINIIEAITGDILNMDTDSMLKASRVMLDAPCSGLGVLNRRADARWRRNYQEMQELIVIQEALLNKAATLVDKGGLLLYSTCTINHAENEDIIKRFLQENQEFGLEGFEEDIAFLPLTAAERNHAASGIFTLLPGKHSTDGMFYARMRRN